MEKTKVLRMMTDKSQQAIIDKSRRVNDTQWVDPTVKHGSRNTSSGVQAMYILSLTGGQTQGSLQVSMCLHNFQKQCSNYSCFLQTDLTQARRKYNKTT